MAKVNASIDVNEDNKSSASASIWSTLVAQCEKTYEMYVRSANCSSSDKPDGGRKKTSLFHSNTSVERQVVLEKSLQLPSPTGIHDQHNKKAPPSPPLLLREQSQVKQNAAIISYEPAGSVFKKTHLTREQCLEKKDLAKSSMTSDESTSTIIDTNDASDDESVDQSSLIEGKLEIDINGNYDPLDKNDLDGESGPLEQETQDEEHCLISMEQLSSSSLMDASEQFPEVNGSFTVDQSKPESSVIATTHIDCNKTSGESQEHSDRNTDDIPHCCDVTSELEETVALDKVRDGEIINSKIDSIRVEVGNDVLAVANLLMALQQKNKNCDEDTIRCSGEKENEEDSKTSEKENIPDKHSNESVINRLNNSCSLIVEDEIDSAVASIMKEGEVDPNEQSTPATPVALLDVSSISNLISQDEEISPSLDTSATPYFETDSASLSVTEVKAETDDKKSTDKCLIVTPGNISPITPVSSPEQTGQSPVTRADVNKKVSQEEKSTETTVITAPVSGEIIEIKVIQQEDTVAKAVAIAINGSDDDEDDLKLPSTTASFLNTEDGGQYVLLDDVYYQLTSASQSVETSERSRAVTASDSTDYVQITSLAPSTIPPPLSAMTGASEYKNIHCNVNSIYSNSNGNMSDYQSILTYRCNVPGCNINHNYSSLNNQRAPIYPMSHMKSDSINLNSQFNGRNLPFPSDSRLNASNKDMQSYSGEYFTGRGPSARPINVTNWTGPSAQASPLEMLEQQFSNSKVNGFMAQSQSSSLSSNYIPIHPRDKWRPYESMKLPNDMAGDASVSLPSQMRSGVKNKVPYYSSSGVANKQPGGNSFNGQYSDPLRPQSSFRRSTTGQSFRSIEEMNSSSFPMYSRGYPPPVSRSGPIDYNYRQSQMQSGHASSSYDVYSNTHLQKQEQPHIQNIYRSFPPGAHPSINNAANGQYLCNDKCCNANTRITSLNAPVDVGKQQQFNSNYGYSSTEQTSVIACVDEAKRLDVPNVRSAVQPVDHQFTSTKRSDSFDVNRNGENCLSLPPAKVARIEM